MTFAAIGGAGIVVINNSKQMAEDGNDIGVIAVAIASVLSALILCVGMTMDWWKDRHR